MKTTAVILLVLLVPFVVIFALVWFYAPKGKKPGSGDGGSFVIGGENGGDGGGDGGGGG